MAWLQYIWLRLLLYNIKPLLTAIGFIVTLPLYSRWQFVKKHFGKGELEIPKLYLLTIKMLKLSYFQYNSDLLMVFKYKLLLLILKYDITATWGLTAFAKKQHPQLLIFVFFFNRSLQWIKWKTNQNSNTDY